MAGNRRLAPSALQFLPASRRRHAAIPAYPQRAYNSRTFQPEMTLSPGTRLGAYEVVALLGVGGMGESSFGDLRSMI